MNNSDIIFASQNASLMVAIISFTVFTLLWASKIHTKRFNIVFYLSLSLSLFLGGYLLHRGLYTVPRINGILGMEVLGFKEVRANILLAVAANLISIGLISLTAFLTKERYGNKLWLTLLFSGLLVFTASLLFAYYY